LGGFTAFGAEVIQACNRLGIVIDPKHMSDDGVKWTLENCHSARHFLPHGSAAWSR
jgi:microsomal dipeptidase-like Zn-dependent dipeptidase